MIINTLLSLLSPLKKAEGGSACAGPKSMKKEARLHSISFQQSQECWWELLLSLWTLEIANSPEVLESFATDLVLTVQEQENDTGHVPLERARTQTVFCKPLQTILHVLWKKGILHFALNSARRNAFR